MSAPKKYPATKPLELHCALVTSLLTLLVMSTMTTPFESMSDSTPNAE